MNSTFFSTQDYTLITEGSPPCGQLGFSHDGWYKVLNKVMDLSTQNSLICVHPYQDGPQCWSTVPCHSKPLPEVFHGCVASVLALTDFAGWAKSSFLEVSSYSAALFPILSYSAELLLNSWSPAHLHSWSLRLFAVEHALVAAQVVCCRSITNVELFLIMGGRTQPVIFIFINPSGHLQLTRFFFWLRQPDSNKFLLAYVFHCNAELLNSKWSEKGSSVSLPLSCSYSNEPGLIAPHAESHWKPQGIKN